ncbi:MAG: ferredoxin--NADP reductase [Bacteroidales bacterium]|nr:ferredoxin--NADP reductase [Bacteroidales bacterium]
MNELNSVIVQILQVSPIMKIIRIKPIGWEFPEFKGGQFVALALPGSAERCNDSTDEFETPADPDKLIKRAYSIASTSTADYVEFYITLVHSGTLTPRLFNLNIGDKVWMGKKGVGMFTLDEVDAKRNIILIATGTGVAPYMSMLRSDALKRKGNIMIIHGAANSWDLGYSSELQLLESMFDSFSYLPTITEPAKEPAGWNGDDRFIGDIWADGIGEKKWGFKPSPEDTDFFLCGNPRMSDGMVEMLEKDGFIEHKRKTPGQIHVEEF